MAKLKLAIVGIIALAAGAFAFTQYKAADTARAENDQLKLKIAALEELSAPSAHEGDATNQPLTAQEAQTRDLARLRAEVAELRKKTNDLAKATLEIAAMKERLANAAEEKRGLLAAANQAQAQAQQAQAQNQNMATARAMNACINNLRLIDSAKQQWALENRKTAQDTPTWDDLKPYIGHGPNQELPACPGGGTYSIGAVGERPTCGIAGHVLP